MEITYLIIRFIRVLTLVGLFVKYYMSRKSKNVAPITGVIIGIIGCVFTIASLIFEIIFGANCLLSVFVLVWLIGYLIIEVVNYRRKTKKYIVKKLDF